jgi:hypothetical protein
MEAGGRAQEVLETFLVKVNRSVKWAKVCTKIYGEITKIYMLGLIQCLVYGLRKLGCLAVTGKELSRGRSHKLFWSKFTHTFCKLDHFINISNICCIDMK